MEDYVKICPECNRKGDSMFCVFCWPEGYKRDSKLNERRRNKAWRDSQNRPHLRFIVTGLKK